MSGTQPDPPQDPVVAVAPAPLPSDALITPQALVTYACLLIGAGSIAAAFIWGDASLRGQAFVAGTLALGAAYNFFLGSSKGSADKDAKTPAAPVVPVPPGVAPAALIKALHENTATTAANTAAAPVSPTPAAEMKANTVATEENTKALDAATSEAKPP